MNQKKILILLMGLGLILAAPLVSHAALFSNTVDFYGTGINDGRTYIELNDGNTTNFVYSYNHNVVFSPAAAEITSAEIILTHSKNSNTPCEIWLISGGTETEIGQLIRSDFHWRDQRFSLPLLLFSNIINEGSWSLEVKLTEVTTGTDMIWLDKSVLSGEYLPVPIPAAAWLLGSGLLGLVVIRRRMKK